MFISRSTNLSVHLELESHGHWRLEKLPEPVEVTMGPLHFTRESTKSESGGLRLTKRARLRVGLVEVGDYPRWIQAAQRVDRADRLELRLIRTAQ
jgi:hypothetical protein